MPQVAPALGALAAVSFVRMSGLQLSSTLLGSGKMVCIAIGLSQRTFPTIFPLLLDHATEPTLRLPPGVVSAPVQLLNALPTIAFATGAPATIVKVGFVQPVTKPVGTPNKPWSLPTSR